MNAIEIKNLTKEYDGFKLDNLNLTLPMGCIMGLIGENGAGKSTTIKLMLNMIKKNSGTITLLGKNTETELKNIKEDIGVVLDEPGFPKCLNAKEINNIMKHIFRSWSEDTFLSYIKKFDIPDKKLFKDYSSGMKMKLSIAVALSHNAKLLILDEATNGLDPVMRDEILDIFNEFTRDENHSILISSHIVSDLEKICDYVAFLHKGKLILCEEKDLLTEQYGMVLCAKEEISTINPNAIIGKKENSYGVSAIIRRTAIPKGMSFNSVSIEDLFIFMVKEEK